MGFYGNIVNYFSAAFKKFKFKNAHYIEYDEENNENKVIKDKNVEALLSQDELIFDSASENYIEYHYKEEQEKDRTVKTIDMRLNVEQLRDDLTVVSEPTLDDNNQQLISKYNINQSGPNNSKHKSEIKYYAEHTPETGRLYIPFIHSITSISDIKKFTAKDAKDQFNLSNGQIIYDKKDKKLYKFIVTINDKGKEEYSFKEETE